MSDVGDLWCEWLVDGLVGLVDRVRCFFSYACASIMRALQFSFLAISKVYCMLQTDKLRFR
jgi:hypothetical protein